MAHKADPPSAAEGGGSGKSTLLAALVAVVVVASIVVAALVVQRPTPEAAAAYEIGKRDRQIARLNKENAVLKEELRRVRGDYAVMIAERRCEAIDGMDDCLAAGLLRPERFRETDAELVRIREAEKARRLAAEQAAAKTPGAGGKPAGEADPKAERSQMKALVDFLKNIPGVKTD